METPPRSLSPSPGVSLSPARDYLSSVANELVVMIADELPTRSDFLSLMRSSPVFYGVLVTRLYSRAAATTEERGIVAWAAERGFVETIRRAINAGHDFSSPRVLNSPSVAYPAYRPTDWQGSHHALARSQMTTAAPLHLAVINRHQNAAALLLDKGANPHHLSTNLGFHEADNLLRVHYRPFPYTAIQLAQSTGQTNMVEILKKHGAKVAKPKQQATDPLPIQSRLHTATARGDNTLVLSILQDHMDHNSWTLTDLVTVINETNSRGNTPLHYLTHFRIAPTATMQESTPTLGANHTININKTIRLLISLGADINAVNNHGQTPLLRACMAGNLEVATALLITGRADPNIGTNGRSVVRSWMPMDFVMKMYERGHRLNVRYWNGPGAEEDWTDPMSRFQGRMAVKEVDKMAALMRSCAAREF